MLKTRPWAGENSYDIRLNHAKSATTMQNETHCFKSIYAYNK